MPTRHPDNTRLACREVDRGEPSCAEMGDYRGCWRENALASLRCPRRKATTPPPRRADPRTGA